MRSEPRVDPAQFVRDNTAVASALLVPEIRLHLATRITPLWHATERTLAIGSVPPPFWAFAWAGGQGLARYLLDHPDEVAGRERRFARFVGRVFKQSERGLAVAGRRREGGGSDYRDTRGCGRVAA